MNIAVSKNSMFFVMDGETVYACVGHGYMRSVNAAPQNISIGWKKVSPEGSLLKTNERPTRKKDSFAQRIDARSLADFLESKRAEIGGERLVRARKAVGEAIEMHSSKKTLRSLRLVKGLTQRELAFHLQTSQSYVQRLETDGIKPSIERAQELAKIFGVELNAILECLKNAAKN